jgi:hypothetical protein
MYLIHVLNVNERISITIYWCSVSGLLLGQTVNKSDFVIGPQEYLQKARIAESATSSGWKVDASADSATRVNPIDELDGVI